MAAISMKHLLEAGVHFGHQTRRWNPKMKPYIFTERNGIYILDLQKTAKLADVAYNFIKDVSENKGIVLFVGTKKQAQDAIVTEAKRCGMYYISNRWLGGLLTNFKTIKKRIDRLKYLDNFENTEEFELRPKKEIIKMMAEREKLEKNLGGIKDMPKMPDAIFIVDPKKEHLAIQEAKKLGIPVVAIVDTNCDPDEVDFVIPGNDDAIRAVKLIAAAMANAVIEGKQGEQLEEEAAAPVAKEVKPVAAPVAKEAKPAAPVAKEEKPAAAPVAEEEKPAAPIAKEEKPAAPVAKEEKPAAPVAKEEKPVAKKAKPAVAKEEKPAAAPKAKKEKPAAAKEEKPAATPKAKKAKPVAKKEKPAADSVDDALEAATE